jgi:hypothetical protein
MIVFHFRTCNSLDKNHNNQCSSNSNSSSLILKLSLWDLRIPNHTEYQLLLRQEAINIQDNTFLINRATISITNFLKDIRSFPLGASCRIQNISFHRNNSNNNNNHWGKVVTFRFLRHKVSFQGQARFSRQMIHRTAAIPQAI